MIINEMTDASLEKILYLNNDIKTFFSDIVPESIGKGDYLGNVLIVCREWQVIEMLETLIARKGIKGKIKGTVLSAIEQPGDMAALLTNLDYNDTMILSGHSFENDEVYCIFKNAIENQTLEMKIGKGPSAQVITLDIPRASYILLITELSRQILNITHLFDHVIKVDNNDLIEMKTFLTYPDQKSAMSDDIYKAVLEISDDDIDVAFQYMIGFLSYCRNNKLNHIHYSDLENYLRINNIKQKTEISTDETIIKLLKDIKKSLSNIQIEIHNLKDDFNTTEKEANDKLETIDSLIREMSGIY